LSYLRPAHLARRGRARRRRLHPRTQRGQPRARRQARGHLLGAAFRGRQAGDAMSASIRRLAPSAVTGGGRLTIEGDGFDVGPGRLPAVTVGGGAARLSWASSRTLAVRVPDDTPGGLQPVTVDGVAGATAFVQVGEPVEIGRAHV